MHKSSYLRMEHLIRHYEPYFTQNKESICILIAPSSGMEHKAPKDCYRYYADGFAALASWADLKVWHTSVGGVPKTGQLDDWSDDWNDGCLVAQKMPFWIETIEEPFAQEKRFPVYGFRDVYKLWEAAVMRAVQKFETKKPVVLFGAGLIGSIALEIMGAENVQYFVDHSSTKIGRKYRGKQIVSAEDYFKESSKYNCLITASYAASAEIRQELESAGAQCAILYDL